jgi:starch synthase
MRIVFVASECVPYSKTGGLADVVGALPKALAATGHEVDVIIPRYGTTKPGRVLPEATSLTIPLASGFRFASVQNADEEHNPRHYLLDCPEFFERMGLYRERGVDYPDNYLRFAGFSIGSLEFLKRFPGAPDVIHCHDWQSALVPIYLRQQYGSDSFFRHTAVLLTIHNLAYQGLFPPQILPQISLDPRLFTIDGLEYYGDVNLLKGGILFSDFISTVSRKYASEIQTEEFGCGLEGVLRKRGDRLYGILNGVDYEAWNPATDKLIAANYTPQDLRGKTTCKKALLERMGITVPVLDRPLLGIVSRFDPQKGFDLIAQIAYDLATMDLYVVVLGTGETEYETLFRNLAASYPAKFLVTVAYDNTLAHQIEAGADMFLMPSRYEPSGLNQLYSMKYGTVPVVRATGGLDDTVENFDGQSGTGFKFVLYAADALLEAIRQAVNCYRLPAAWSRLMQNCMAKDFSWGNSASEYGKIYEALHREKMAPKLRARGNI